MDEVIRELERHLGLSSNSETDRKSMLTHLSSLDQTELTGYLEALLPPSPEVNKFIEHAVKTLGKAKGGRGTPVKKQNKKKETSAATGGGRKMTVLNRSPKNADFASRTPEELSRIRAQRRFITGNEDTEQVPLVENCLDCGMIYLAEKYADLSLCEYCDEPLGKAQKKRGKLFGTDETDEMREALAHRDRLVDFDNTSAERTKVYDDQADYFEVDVDVLNSKWASESEKAQIQEQLEQRETELEAQRNMVKLNIDFKTKRATFSDQTLQGTVAGQVFAKLSQVM